MSTEIIIGAVSIYHGRQRPTKVPQPEWFKTVRVGDILKSGSGDYRMVRAVTRWPNGRLHVVQFATRKCSQFNRPNTMLSPTHLRSRGFTHTGVNMAHKMTAFDEDLAVDFEDYRRRKYHCCDVKTCA